MSALALAAPAPQENEGAAPVEAFAGEAAGPSVLEHVLAKVRDALLAAAPEDWSVEAAAGAPGLLVVTPAGRFALYVRQDKRPRPRASIPAPARPAVSFRLSEAQAREVRRLLGTHEALRPKLRALALWIAANRPEGLAQPFVPREDLRHAAKQLAIYDTATFSYYMADDRTTIARHLSRPLFVELENGWGLTEDGLEDARELAPETPRGRKGF